MTTILVGTEQGLFSIDTLAEQPRVEQDSDLTDVEVTALAKDGAGLVALVEGESIRRTERSGGPWTEIVRVTEWTARCLLPTPKGLLVGTAEAHLLRVADGVAEPVESFDGAPEREKWYTPWGGPPDTRSMSADAAGTIYVNVHVGGILRSDDGGASWRPTIDVDTDVHQVLAHPSRRDVVLAAAAVGLAISRDSGASWEFETDGLHAAYARAVAVSGDSILVTAAAGPFAKRGALYRAPLDGPLRFEKCDGGLPTWFGGNVDTGLLDADGSAVALGSPEGWVYLSKDGGATWRLLIEHLPPLTQVLLA